MVVQEVVDILKRVSNIGPDAFEVGSTSVEDCFEAWGCHMNVVGV
jgi:hypothetical protein